jgi:polyketide biosynthesis enoyl-CoA hydratase PksI
MQDVVDFYEPEDGVVVLTMHDRETKNAFSPALIDGLMHAYARIKNNPFYRAIVLTGYDNYFCSGATYETLMALNEARGKFSDVDIHRLALDCEVPVIAAMQGHAIGGGFVMGLFCDIVILARESSYTANFMNYGFTPGMGATYVLPAKLGMALGNEMLLAAQAHNGAALQLRGVPFTVVPRSDVLPAAINLATDFANKPRLSLVTLKRHLNLDLCANLPSVIERELEMHAITMHQPEVRRRISSLYGR